MEEQFAPIPPEAEQTLPARQTLAGRAARLLLRRAPVWPLIAFLAKKRVPEHRHSLWYMIGGAALFFLVVQIATGILLMIYYRPSEPWRSVNRIVMEVPFGAVVRSVHHWSANLMVLTLFLHSFSTLFMKAYRGPRELTWLTGVGLLGLTLLFGFSGYLLPWDELSFFATRVGITEMEKAPLIGTWLANLARGGSEVTTDTIGRFYALHVVVLPLAVLGLVGLHLLLIQIQGVSEPDSFRALPPAERRYRTFFFDYVLSEVPVWLFLGALLFALSAAMPRTVGPEANAFAAAPEGIKPEWYMLVPYQALKLFPGKLELLGIAVVSVLPLLVLALPFFDRAVPSDARGRLVTRAAVLGLAGFVAMTIWGYLS